MNLMSKLNHPNIVKFITGWYKPKLNKVIMITEFISGGSLKLNIKNFNNQPRLRLIKKWIKEILKGLSYLHNQNIIHRDIKCDNIFIDRITGNVKIGDLGNGIIAKKKFYSQFIGTEEFMAPEIHEGKYSFKVDIYSLGLTIIEMLTLETPYKECEGTLKIYENKKNEIYPESFYKINNENLKNFIKLCLKKESERPNAFELLKNKWLNDDESYENNFPVNIKNSLRLDVFQYKPQNNFIPLMIKNNNIIEKKKLELNKSSFSPIQIHSNILKDDIKKFVNQRGKSYDKEIINHNFYKRNSSRQTDDSTVDSQKTVNQSNENNKIIKKNSSFKITINDKENKEEKKEIEIQFVIGKEEWKNKSKKFIYFFILEMLTCPYNLINDTVDGLVNELSKAINLDKDDKEIVTQKLSDSSI